MNGLARAAWKAYHVQAELARADKVRRMTEQLRARHARLLEGDKGKS